MPRPAVYLDECVDHALVPALQDRGFVPYQVPSEDWLKRVTLEVSGSTNGKVRDEVAADAARSGPAA